MISGVVTGSERGCRQALPAPPPGKPLRKFFAAALGARAIDARFDGPVSGLVSMALAGVAELVDALDLGSSVARRGGSSPSARTKSVRAGAGTESVPAGTPPMAQRHAKTRLRFLEKADERRCR